MAGKGRFALRFVSGKYQGGEFALPVEGEILIGRASELDLILVEDMVSRKHAKLVVDHDQLEIVDLGSTNGTYVNNERVRRGAVEINDIVRIGRSVLEVIDSADLGKKKPFDAGDVRRDLEALAASRPEHVHMTGELEEVSLADLLQLFASGTRTGVLLITGPQSGKLYMRQGNTIFAFVEGKPDFPPLKALFRMLTWRTGHFEFKPDQQQPHFKQEIQEQTESAIMEGVRQVDEMNRLLGELPSADAEIAVVRPLKPKLSALEAATLDVFQLVINERKVQAVLDASPEADFNVYSALHSLFEGGYIRKVPTKRVR